MFVSVLTILAYTKMFSSKLTNFTESSQNNLQLKQITKTTNGHAELF